MTQTLLYLAAGSTLFFLLALCSIPLLLKPEMGSERLMGLAASKRSERRIIRSGERFQNGLSELLTSLRNRLGLRISAKLRDQLQAAGLRGPYAVDGFSAVQWLAPLVGAFIASFLSSNVLFWCLVFGAGGYLLPGIWLTRRIARRKQKIRHSLPDAMDLLVICVDAGLGLDQAMMRVSDELALSHREIQEEFHRVQLEQRAGSNRMEAWKRLAERLDIEEITAFVSMLVQTEKFGTPIARALSRFAEDLRIKRRQQAEEAAAKTKVKIVFPLVFFIFPCLFIVLLAPAILGLMSTLQDMK